jgi:hypothetical protein
VNTTKVPYLGEFKDEPVNVAGVDMIVRVWPLSWLTVISPTCELVKQHESDSRLVLAPIVFRSLWDGDHWKEISEGKTLPYAYLPPITEQQQREFKAEGWPTDMDAAVVLGSGTVASHNLAGSPRFGMDAVMRMRLQQRLVLWQSERDWKSSSQFKELRGKRIVDVVETHDRHAEGGILFKLALEDDFDDEATLGIVLRPRR